MNKPNLIKSKPIEKPNIHMYERYLPTAFDESLTILEKINKVIHFLYKYSDLTIEMMDRWNEVYEWVMNEGLNESVVNRLNELLDDGTLEGLINEVLLKDINDKVDDIESQLDTVITDVIQTIANEMENVNQTINDFQNETLLELNKIDMSKIDLEGFYKLNTKTYRDELSNTTYHISIIPLKDENNNTIKLKHDFTSDSYPSFSIRTVRESSYLKKASLSMNASPYSVNTGKVVGLVIKNGEIIQNESMEDYNYILAFNEENNMKSFPPNTNPDIIINQGFTQAITGFIPLIENSTSVSDGIINTRDIFSEYHPRSVIAQNSQGNVVFFVSEGRAIGENGMTAKDVIRVLLSHGMTFAFMLDGGGSSQLTLYHSIVNRLSDDNGMSERKVGNILYVGKEDVNDNSNNLLNLIGENNYNISRLPSHFNSLRYTRSNHIELTDYLINGWKNYGSSGSSVCRAWVLPNNTLYLVGTITGGELGKPFMQLPDFIQPMFTTHHLVVGNQENEIYKVIINTNRNLQWYYWNDTGRPPNTDGPDYIKLDGIFIPLNTPRQGV